MDMPAGSGVPAGSVNMDDPCYANPSDAACAGFNRTDAGEARSLCAPQAACILPCMPTLPCQPAPVCRS
jgi:hypothetical protein